MASINFDSLATVVCDAIRTQDNHVRQLEFALRKLLTDPSSPEHRKYANLVLRRLDETKDEWGAG